VIEVVRYQGLFIDGEFTDPQEREAVINPATEEAFAEAPLGSLDHVEAAIAAAREAFDRGPWPGLPTAERQRIVSAFLDGIERRAGAIIDLIVAEAGSTRMLAKFLHYDIPMQHARATVQIAGRPAITPLPVETAPAPDGRIILGGGVMVRDPAGVVAAITPYNFPFFLNVAKIVPAMLVGCTVVLKPSPYTPLQALILGEIAREAGIPRGVLNIVTGGREVGEALTTDRRVDLVTFTGSDTVGSAIQAQAAPTLKRLLLELGGKSAMIVRPDADLQAAAAAGLMGFTVHAGQGCALLTRHVVHNAVRDEYVERVKQMAASLTVGDPADPGVDMGPLIRDAARRRSEEYVQIALDGGATLVTGGKRPAGLKKGFFFEPTLFNDVRNTDRIAREEVFGPIGVVIGYDDDEEALAIANDSDFGLSGAIYSADVGLAYEMALRMRTGGVAINDGPGGMSSHAPFGGVKRSGYGREYGLEGLNEFTHIKTIGFRVG
jgi:aldehyde dehydrogenase (NAD+)